MTLDQAAGAPPVIARAFDQARRRAIAAADGRVSYAELLVRSHRVASCLLDGDRDLAEARVAYLVAPGCAWVATQWGIWRAGGMAVPLAESHPPVELDQAIADAGAAMVVADAALRHQIAHLVRGLDDDLGADAGRVAHGQGKSNGSVH